MFNSSEIWFYVDYQIHLLKPQGNSIFVSWVWRQVRSFHSCLYQENIWKENRGEETENLTLIILSNSNISEQF